MDKHVLHNILHRDAGNSSKDCPVCNGSMSMDDKKAMMSKASQVLEKKQQMGMMYSEEEKELSAFNEKEKEQQPILITSVDLMSFAEKGKLPTRIKILPYGTIKSPVYGDVVLNKQVMEEMAKHFDEDLRASSSKIGLPIDVEHGETSLKDAAAGWMKKLFAEEDGGYADVDWTPLGQKKLIDKEYKLLSPSFYLKGFKHPETGKEYQNVLTGAALVNKPGMPSLPPIVNSEAGQKDPLTQQQKASTIFIEITKSLPNFNMNLKEIVAKEKSTRTSEEQAFLVAHKDELTFKEYQAEGFLEAKKEEKPAEVKPAAGQILMSEKEANDLRAAAAALKKENAIKEIKQLTFSEKGVKVPADQVEKLADVLLALPEAQQITFKESLKALPEKEVFTEKGTTTTAPAGTAAAGDLDKKIHEFMEKNKCGYTDAVKQMNKLPEYQLQFKEVTAKENMPVATFEA